MNNDYDGDDKEGVDPAKVEGGGQLGVGAPKT